MAEYLLSDLCSICHIQVPKYRCPRCKTRTCSAACVQLHKTRGPCTGVRDATGYVKKAQLATSSGIDHDYNFIRGLERVIEDGEKRIQERGLHDEAKWTKYAGALRGRMREVGVRVEKAPVGMQRERDNKTHWAPKARHILWTVEWIEEDGSRHLDEVGEKTSIEQAYAWLLRRIRQKRKPVIEDRSQGESQRRKQTKTKQATTDNINKSNGDETTTEGTVWSSSPNLADRGNENGIAQNQITFSTCEESGADLSVKAVSTTTTEADALQSHSGSSGRKQASVASDSNSNSMATGANDDMEKLAGSNPAQTQTPTSKPLYFYLVKPRTGLGRGRQVIVPLENETTLAIGLKGQHVLEFPTIQVLSQSSDSLPDGFMTEAQFEAFNAAEKAKLEQAAKEADGLEEYISLTPQSQRSGSRGPERLLNQGNLLAVINKDMRN